VSAATAARRGGDSTTTWVVAGGLTLLLVVAVLVLGPDGGGKPLSPRSNDRLGTSALVRLERELGADVRIADDLPDLASADAPDVMLLFTDLLSDEQRDAVGEWVDDGGVLVVTDPASAFVPTEFHDFAEVSDLGPAATLRGQCEIGALDRIDVSRVRPLHGGALYLVLGNADVCLSDGTGLAYIAVRGQGSGTIVSVGGAGMMVNAALAEGNNAPVASALLATGQGTDIVMLEPGPLGTTGGGNRTLLELVSPGVKRFVLQLGVAFVAFALWRGRRLGRPVSEPQPVKVAASELVAAVGGLLDRSRSPGHAAALMRADLRRFLGDRMGLAPGSADDALVSVVAARTGVAEERLRLALTDPVTDDAGLVRLASTIDSIRQEVLAHV
jgi:hypothetical protein